MMMFLKILITIISSFFILLSLFLLGSMSLYVILTYLSQKGLL